jgi:hypothetical protein
MGTLSFSPQNLITGNKMFMPENTIYVNANLTEGILFGLQNEFKAHYFPHF